MVEPYGGGPPAPPAPPPPGIEVRQILSVAAIGLAVLAIVVAFAVPGPAGLTGPAGGNGADGAQGLPGPTGPRGPGSIVATNSTTAVPQQQFGAGCNHFNGADVAINATGAGRIVLWGTVRFSLSHTNGATDLVWFFLTNTTTSCSLTDATTVLRYNSQEPTQVYFETTTIIDSFSVGSAGTYKFYVNAQMVSGSLNANDYLESAFLVAVFYGS